MVAIRRFLLRLAALVRSGHAEADLARELGAHLQMLEDRFVADGMTRDEARLAARRAFGGQVEQVKERQRDERSFRWIAESWLDLKLGARMVVKYPGLTLIAVFALAVAIGGGAAYLEFVHDLSRPTLAAPGGDRIVGIYELDVAAGRADLRALHDFGRWRGRLTAIEHLGATRRFDRNLVTDDGRAEPVQGVEISASAFALIPAQPLLGRPLLAADETAGAPPVVLLGHTLWRARFGADSSIVGRAIRLGNQTYAVVGVMPEGFGFPINNTLWVPLAAGAGDVRRGEGAPIRMFGRLAPGATAGIAEAELTAIAKQAAAEDPASNQQLLPQVHPYVESLWRSTPGGQVQIAILYSVNLVFIALLAVCGANVATLVFGRTLTREGEISVRVALGAGRSRIVAQLFAEALVLASLAAAAGLGAATFALAWGKASWMAGAGEGAAPPFWWDDRLSAETWFYTVAMTLLAALMVGVVPALKATGSEMQSRMRHAAAGAGMRFGGMWTGVIVAQVSLTVVFLLSVVALGWNFFANEYRGGDVAFARSEYLSARFELDRDAAVTAEPPDATGARFGVIYQDLERRLAAEPGIDSVTYASAMPGMKHGEFFVEFRDVRPILPAQGPLWVQTASVAPNLFDTFRVPIVAGRGFTAADAELDLPVAIVDQSFVQHVLGGRNPIGQLVREPQNRERETAGRWYEIVGVVSDLSIARTKTSEDAVLYRPTGPGRSAATHVVLHARGDAAALAPRLRALAAAVDPTLRLYEVMTLDKVNEADQITSAFFLRVFGLVSAVALLLSTAGVYALMAFTVARRTREIGIRVAVGANRRQILTGIFSRTFAQVGLGVLVGCVPGGVLIAAGAPEVASGSGAVVAAAALAAVTVFMFAVASLACAVPARRVLRIQPTDALRTE